MKQDEQLKGWDAITQLVEYEEKKYRKNITIIVLLCTFVIAVNVYFLWDLISEVFK